jgi:hypothetical protein
MSDTARQLLLGIFLLGLVGISVELLLLGHDEDVTQLIPLILAGLALVSVAHVGLSRNVVSVRGFRAVMSLFILSGVVGAALHFQVNVEFQLEMDPTMGGLALLQKAIRAKAPPALAPGAMIQLGLIGLAYTFRYPRLSRSDT